MTVDDAALRVAPHGGDDLQQSLAGARVRRLDDFEPAVPLSDDELAAYRRRFSLLFVDEDRVHRGGNGEVVFATNAQGEPLGLKTPLPLGRVGEVAGAEAEAYAAEQERALRHEYEMHRAANGLRGVPRLYGYGHLDGQPVIVMEWVRGITLESASRLLSLDEEGRVSTVATAQIGRDLYGLLAVLTQVGDGFVHGDISPANVLVRTSHLSLDEQVREGSFDLCLVDFGSARWAEASDGDADSEPADPSDAPNETLGYAYAAPEAHDVRRGKRWWRSPKVDVYAAGAVLYQLIAGHAPQGSRSGGTRRPPERPMGVHGPGCDLARALGGEPQVATEVAGVLVDMRPQPDEQAVRQALELVDEQLVDVVMTSLETQQDRRPSADALRTALASFCSLHPRNLRRALLGQALLPCMGDTSWYASVSPLALRRLVRSVGTGVSTGVWAVVVVGTAILASGTPATISLPGRPAASLTLDLPLILVALALPSVAAYAVRGRDVGSRRGFWRGSVLVWALSGVLAALVGCLGFVRDNPRQGLLAAVLASAAAGWCPMVLDYATTVVPALVREARRRLPAAAADPGPAVALGDDGVPSHGLESGESAHEGPDVSYEVPHEDDE